MAVVVFDAEEFREGRPQFTEELISDAELETCFEMACLILDNTDKSRIPYDPDNGVTTRKTLLYMLVCHIATLSLWPIGQSGPVASASEGSVSTSFQQITLGSGSEWYSLTPCGMAFWKATAPYRLGLISKKPRHFHPWG